MTKTVNKRGNKKCKRKRKVMVLEEIEKPPNKYKIIVSPKGSTDSKENITIAAQNDIWPIGRQ